MRLPSTKNLDYFNSLYDADGMLIKTSNYDITRESDNGQAIFVTDGDLKLSRSFNRYGEQQSEAYKVGNNEVFSYKVLERTPKGQIKTKLELLNGATTLYNYTYDLKDRLTEVKQDGVVVEQYKYDANGNRAATSNTLRGIDSYRAYYDLDDSLEQFGPERYAYDEDGYIKSKTTSEGTTTYSYGTLGELKEVVLPNGDIITYRHNANNQRVAKLKNNQVVEKYLWLNLTTLLAVYDKDDKLLQRFEYADGRMPLSFTDNSGDRFYISYNQIGSPRAITDRNGNILKTLTYDSFGTIIADSNPTFKIPFGFAGGLYDSDTKLTRFGYRDYDASTGKWTAKDPIGFDGGDTNLYGYVLGDPVGVFDPMGLYIDPRLKDKGVPSVMGGNSNSPWLGLSDMWDNYQKMKKADTKGIDKYFHCLANCHATNRGIGGKNMAESISDFREWYQEPFDGAKACEADQIANRQGRKGGNCAKTCEQFKPSWMPDWVEQ